MSQPLILNLAATGAVHSPEQNPMLPTQPEAIVQDVLACVAEGVSMAHLHARDAAHQPSTDATLFARMIAPLRQACPALIVVASTSGRLENAFEKRASALFLPEDVRPDMASLTLSSLNFLQQASVNPPEMIMRLAATMLQQGVKPELEVFDLGMINVAHYLIKKGLLQPPYYFNLMLGNVAGAQAKMSHLALLVSELPQPCVWSVAGLGRFHRTAMALGVAGADGLRVGLEDCLWWDEAHTQPASNRQWVQQASALAQAHGRPWARPDEVRARLDLCHR